jgi:hypothetical protein
MYDLDRVVRDFYRPIQNKLEKMADGVLLANAADRKTKLSSYINELDKQESIIESNAKRLFNAYLREEIKPQNNC